MTFPSARPSADFADLPARCPSGRPDPQERNSSFAASRSSSPSSRSSFSRLRHPVSRLGRVARMLPAGLLSTGLRPGTGKPATTRPAPVLVTLSAPGRARTSGGPPSSGATGLARSVARSRLGTRAPMRSGAASTSTKAPGTTTTHPIGAVCRWIKASWAPTAPSSSPGGGSRIIGRRGRNCSPRSAPTTGTRGMAGVGSLRGPTRRWLAACARSAVAA